MAEDLVSVELEYAWPIDWPHHAADETCLQWNFYGVSPALPNVGELVVFKHPDHPKYLQGEVERREFGFSSGSYQNRSESSITLRLTSIREWARLA